jgi:hypothetical protein
MVAGRSGFGAAGALAPVFGCLASGRPEPALGRDGGFEPGLGPGFETGFGTGFFEAGFSAPGLAVPRFGGPGFCGPGFCVPGSSEPRFCVPGFGLPGLGWRCFGPDPFGALCLVAERPGRSLSFEGTPMVTALSC